MIDSRGFSGDFGPDFGSVASIDHKPAEVLVFFQGFMKPFCGAFLLLEGF